MWEVRRRGEARMTHRFFIWEMRQIMSSFTEMAKGGDRASLRRDMTSPALGMFSFRCL